MPPKKLVESRSVKTFKDGKEWTQMHPWYHFGDPHEILKGYKIMEYLRVVPPEEMAQREEERKAKDEKRRAHREAVREAKMKRKQK